MMGIDHAQLRQLAHEYPEGLRPKALMDVDRQVFHVSLVEDLVPGPEGAVVADIGGGLSMLSPALTMAGMRAVLVDDFKDQGYDRHRDHVLELHRRRGVEVLDRDVIAEGLDLEAGSLDAAISIDSMEHFHHSPKPLFRDILAALKPGGWFVIGVPNNVNLRKRVMVPLGRAKWSHMSDWYESPTFRGHVREPDVEDLHYIAGDLGLTEVTVMGRNWQGHYNPRPWVRRLTPYVDRALQRRPALCSDLYLLGRKPAGPQAGPGAPQ